MMNIMHNRLVQIALDFNSHVFTYVVYFTTVSVDIEQRETTNVNTHTDICCTLTGHASVQAKSYLLYVYLCLVAL